jgi:glucokinase
MTEQFPPKVADESSEPAALLLGIDFGGTKTAIAVATDDDIVAREEIPTNGPDGAAGAISRAVETGKRLLAAHGRSVQGVGVATMGVTLEDRVLMAPAVPGWEDLAIPPVLRAAFPDTPVRIENDVNAATFAELRSGALRGVETGIYVNLGTGIACGIVVGGRVLRGAHGAAGEIGFNPRTPDDEIGAPAGRVPLEEFAGGGAIARRAATRFGIDPADLFSRYHEDDAIRAFVDETINELGFHLANLAIALDPTRIAIGAGLMRSGELVLGLLRDRIARYTPFPVEVVAARYTVDAALMGALELAKEPLPGM